MAVGLRLDPSRPSFPDHGGFLPQNLKPCSLTFPRHDHRSRSSRTSARFSSRRRRSSISCQDDRGGSDPNIRQDEEEKSPGVEAALSMLRFYKREISPVLPNSCRYIPTCSEYSMEAYKKYGVVKGTVLTAWRLCRCNPLGGSGFDPPRWFDEERPSPED